MCGMMRLRHRITDEMRIKIPYHDIRLQELIR